ncbi:MAG: putative bifunctional diguanylate cyclase/phosphodiesterase [Candidatus Baltobacteraceae bacterium]
MERRPRLSPVQSVAVAALYLAAWVGSDLLGSFYNGAHGTFYPWYLGAALTFYLIYTFGYGYAPLAVIAEIARPLLFPATAHLPFITYLEFGVIAAIGYSIVVVILKRVLVVRLPFETFQDAANFCGVAIVAPLILALLPGAIAVSIFGGGWQHYLREVVSFWVGDTLGLLVLVPILAAYLTPRFVPEPEESRPPVFDVQLRERVLLYATVVGATFLGYAAVLTGVSGDPLRYFVFLPLMWMAARGGLRLAIPGIFVTDALTSVLNFIFPTTSVHPIDLQTFIVISAISSLSVGALVDQRARAERQTRALAFTNSLSGLPNRRGLERWLGRSEGALLLALIDIDHMKLTNEGLTRAAGDELLKRIAERCADFTDAEFVAHVSADEFAIVARGSSENAELLGRRITEIFEEPLAVEEHELYVSVSIGIAIANAASEYEEVLRHADLAMYRAKQAGRGRAVLYTPDLADEKRTLSLATELHAAVRNREFVLFYQPIFEFIGENLRCTGVEALLRWNHPRLGFLEPAAFLEFLENMTLAERVGLWVLGEAARQAREWLDADIDLQVWINLFPRQALDPQLPEHLKTLLDEHGLSPSRFVLEIVERVIAEDTNDIERAVRALRNLGTMTAIDDFGTGHSSLARLREVPVDVMKIDQQFVARCEIDDKASGVVQAVLKIAQELRLRPLAEGIENEAQLERLRFYGCRYVQGYFLARPMRADDFYRWLTAARV